MKHLIAIIFGQKKRKTIDISNINSILLKPIGTAVGDTIVHLAHIKQLKMAFPNIKIGVLVTERCKAIYEQSGLVDVILNDHYLSYLSQCGKWDLYLDFMPTFTSRSLVLDKFLNVKYVINFGKKNKKHYNLDTIHNYDYSVTIPQRTHFKDYLKHSPLGPYLSEATYELKYPQQYKNKTFWKYKDKIKILLNPQGSTRELPAEELNLLIANILEPEQVELLLTNTSESDDYFAKLTPRANLNLAEKTSLFEYFSLIESANIVVSVDGGGVHITCALGKPLLAFYSNNVYNLYKWFPIPKPYVECLTLVTTKTSENSNETKGFDMKEAAEWLNHQIANLK